MAEAAVLFCTTSHCLFNQLCPHFAHVLPPFHNCHTGLLQSVCEPQSRQGIGHQNRPSGRPPSTRLKQEPPSVFSKPITVKNNRAKSSSIIRNRATLSFFFTHSKQPTASAGQSISKTFTLHKRAARDESR